MRAERKTTMALSRALAGVFVLACDGRIDVGQLQEAVPHDSVPVAGSDASLGAPRPDVESPGTSTPPGFGADGEACNSPLASSDAASSDAACYATCCTPAGTIEVFHSVEEMYSALVGQWQFCTGAAYWQAAAPPDMITIGVEFAPSPSPPPEDGGPVGGDLYFLVQGPSGPVRGPGARYQGTYSVDWDTFYTLWVGFPQSGGAWSTSILYSPCPRELDITSLGYNSGSILVPFF